MNGLVFVLFLKKTIDEQPVLVHIVHLGLRSEGDNGRNLDPKTWLDDPAGAGWLFDNCLFDCLQDLRVVLGLEVVFGQGFCADYAGSGRWFSNRWPCFKRDWAPAGQISLRSFCCRSAVAGRLFFSLFPLFLFISTEWSGRKKGPQGQSLGRGHPDLDWLEFFPLQKSAVGTALFWLVG